MINEKYACEICGKTYEWEGDAELCHPSVDHVYECDECEKTWDYDFDGNPGRCDGEDCSKVVNQRFLEEHGQQRLLNKL